MARFMKREQERYGKIIRSRQHQNRSVKEKGGHATPFTLQKTLTFKSRRNARRRHRQLPQPFAGPVDTALPIAGATVGTPELAEPGGRACR